MIKKFLTNDKREIDIELIEGTQFFAVNAFSNNKKIGYCTFNIRNRTCWIYKIEVAEASFLGSGVGTIMLKVMENYVKSRRIDTIEGKFYPIGIGADRSKQFYERNGYSIDKDGYEQLIYKSFLFKNEKRIEEEFSM